MKPEEESIEVEPTTDKSSQKFTVGSEMKAFIKLFNRMIDKMPFAGKFAITPTVVAAFSERDPIKREAILIQSLVLMLIMCVAHGLTAGGVFMELDKEPEKLLPSMIELSFFIANAAVVIRQLNLSSRLLKKFVSTSQNSREFTKLLFISEADLAELIFNHIMAGDVAFIKYLVSIKGKKRVTSSINRALQVCDEACPAQSFISIIDGMSSSDRRKQLIEKLTALNMEISNSSLADIAKGEETKSKKQQDLQLFIETLFTFNSRKSHFTFKEAILMIAVTGGAQLSLLLKDLL